MFHSIHTLNVDQNLELFGVFFDQKGLFFGPVLGSKTVLGSTYMYYQVSYLLDSQNLSFKTS